MDPTVTIIIVNYNRRDLLARGLESINKNSGNIETEIIVVDNASSDDSADFVEQYHKNVRLIRNSTNRGFAAANNQGIEIAKGEYIFFLNSDTILLKGAIEGLLDTFQEFPSVGLVAPKLLNSDLTTQPSVYHFPTFAAMFSRYTICKYFGMFKKARSYYRMRDFDYNETIEIDRPMGAAMMAKKDTLKKIGNFDDNFFFYFEEVDLCRRLKESGFAVYFTPDAQIVHLGGGSSEALGQHKTIKLFFRSMFYYFRKNEGNLKTFFVSLVFKPTVLMYLLLEVLLGIIKSLIYIAIDRKRSVNYIGKAKEAGLFLLKYGLSFLVY